MVSASFSLVEAYLSGIFFTALGLRRLGKLACEDGQLSSKESAPLKERLDRIVRFVSSGAADGQSEPFKAFIEIGKRYRDAIHHTTPFERKDVEAGTRLLALYEIKTDVALLCAFLALNSVLKVSRWIYGEDDASDVTERSARLQEKIVTHQVERGFATVSD